MPILKKTRRKKYEALGWRRDTEKKKKKKKLNKKDAIEKQRRFLPG